MPTLDRRRFLKTSAVTLPSLSAVAAAGAGDRPNEKLLVAIMGVHGRGKDLLRGFAGLSDVEIAYVCDPDAKVLAPALKEAEKRQKRTPRAEKDVRKVLDDKDVTALVAPFLRARTGRLGGRIESSLVC